MPPPSRKGDPNGYYARLGVDPAATPEAITAAFRRKALLLHPDVPGTGNTEAFVAVRHAYDTLSNPERRARYDQAARDAEQQTRAAPVPPSSHRTTERTEPGWVGAEIFEYRRAYEPEAKAPHRPQPHRIALVIWLGVGAVLCIGIVQAVLHLRSPATVATAGIRPNAAPVEPLSPIAQRSVLYGPPPVRLAGVPNYYVLPAASAAVLWRQDPDHDGYKPIGQLPPFSSVQALRLNRQTGMVEVRYNEASTVFIDSKRLAPGDAEAARRAYCGYNAGPTPFDGEVLEQRGKGTGTLQIENRTVQPAVVKLRENKGGAVVLSVFLGPGGQADLIGLPAGDFQTEFAIGELWSRACNTFAAGMRARRLINSLATTTQPMLVLPSGDDPSTVDIADREFESQ